MSKLSKTLSLLDFFGPDRLQISTEFMIEHTGYSKATVYRNVKDLCDAGLLMRVGNANYGLGPRIIEMDWMMRQYDPILIAGRELMDELSRETRLAALTSSFYDERIINTYIVEPSETFAFHFGRGQPMPLFSGAQSKVLVAHLNSRKLRNLFEARLAGKPGGPNGKWAWKEFSRAARKIRKDGYCMTSGELTKGLTGIAAPIFSHDRKEVVASLSVLGHADRFDLLRPESVVSRVIETADCIAANLAARLESQP